MGENVDKGWYKIIKPLKEVCERNLKHDAKAKKKARMTEDLLQLIKRLQLLKINETFYKSTQKAIRCKVR